MDKQRWTLQEVSTLKQLYAEASWPEILGELPRWDKRQIMSKAHELNLKKVNRMKVAWTPEEDAVLKRYYLTKPMKEIKKMLSRPGISIYARANRLGMRRIAEIERQDTSSVAEHHKRMIAKYFGKSVS